MRTLRIVGWIVASLIALLVVAALAVHLFVDPNAYKDRIIRAVKASTGRDLALPGDIKLSVFPSLSLALGPATLGNPPGFDAEPFAALQHVSLRVRLLPLLRKELEVGRIEIDGLDLRLRKNAAGQGNWQSPKTTAATPESSGGGSGAVLQDLGGVVIRDSRIAYQDMLVDQINLDVGRFAAGVEVPVKLKLRVLSNPHAQPIDLSGQFGLKADSATSQYQLSGLKLEGEMGGGAGAARVPWKFSASQVDLDLNRQTVSAPALDAQLGVAQLAAALQGEKIVDAPQVSGSFKLEPLAPRKLMSELGIVPPASRDPKALSTLAADGRWHYDGKQALLDQLEVQLDDSHLKGTAGVTDLKTMALAFNLALDRIDIDRYRPPPQPASKAAPAPAQGKSSSDALKTLQLDGNLTLGSAVFAGLKVSNVHLAIHAGEGLTHLAPVSAQLYGGQYSGDITLDDRGTVLQSRLEQTLTAVDVAQLLQDLAKTQRLSGRGNITTSLTARGADADAVLRSLNGKVTANLDNGAVEGVDLWFEINRAMALVQKQGLPSGSSSGRTKFDSFKASADVVNGVATTKDLNIASQNLRVTGAGTSNLVTEAVNYQVNAVLLKGAPVPGKAPAAALGAIPLSISGSMASPQVRVDLQALAKAQLQEQLDKHKGELKDQLQNKLKDLLK